MPPIRDVFSLELMKRGLLDESGQPSGAVFVPATQDYLGIMIAHSAAVAAGGGTVALSGYYDLTQGGTNTTPLPAKIYANEGISQVLFFESDEECETSYKDRGGKYQGQLGVTLPKI